MLLLSLYIMSLMLSELHHGPGKLRRVFSEEAAERISASTSIIGRKVRAFLLMRTVAGLASGTLSLGLFWIADVPQAPMWAGLVFLLNYIPNVGSLIAAIPPVVVTAATGTLATAGVVMVGMFVIEQLVGNVLDPRLQGRTLRLSPLAILLYVVWFTWVWGIAGTMLAVPMLVLTVVTLEQIPTCAPYAVLLHRNASSDPLTHDINAT